MNLPVQQMQPGIRWPAPSRPLLGRAREVAELHTLVAQRGVRLLTLTGPGGVGKTRLAVELCTALPDAVFVSLVGTSSPQRALEEICRALGREVGDDPFDSVCVMVGESACLLVLDNVEQLLSLGPPLMALLERCPRLQLVLTSRHPLRVAPEQEYPVAPLALPSAADPDAPSLHLLLASSAPTTPDELDAARELCRRLDGLPLALELASARLRLLSPRQLLARLNLALLECRPSPETHHHSLHAVLDSSAALLSEEERRVFLRLGVFAGSCTVEAAEDVAQAPLGSLEALLEHSLLQRDGERLWMLNTVHEYAHAHLRAGPEWEETQARQARWMLARSREAELALRGPEGHHWVQRLHDEQPNVRLALGWSLGHDLALGLELAGTLALFWASHGYLHEAVDWLDQVLDAQAFEAQLPGPPPTTAQQTALAKALGGRGGCAIYSGDFAAAEGFLRRALTLWQGVRHVRGELSVLNNLGIVCRRLGRPQEAEAYLRGALPLAQQSVEPLLEAAIHNGLGTLALGRLEPAVAAEHFSAHLTLRRQLGDREGEAAALGNLAHALLEAGDYDRAERLHHDALRVARELGDVRTEGIERYGLGFVAIRRGQWDSARTQLLASLQLSLEHGHAPNTATALFGLSCCLAVQQPRAAAWVYGALERLHRQLGLEPDAVERQDAGRHLAPAERRLGPEVWREALARGHALPLETLLADVAALPLTDAPDPALSGLGLTGRELELLRLLAQGYTDKKLAALLRITPRTVSTHLSHIYAKLGVRTRTQAARFALDHQLD
ncbi:tetratricopeptide repeat protein [Deinococcus sp. KSM4-11]|uniref:tetratricopeptide repeat protein n=1 Tax=Deinococcus sp. KSM4-11 TaxID=2568654 RepID=UPI001454CE3D|nr:tetratricopeptide repeat protein [Deinococcus sp. KSM4-11]